MSRLTEMRLALAGAVAKTEPPQPVTFQIRTGPTTFDELGLDQQIFEIVAIIDAPPAEGTEELLDELLESEGPLSIKAAVESDRQLAGAADLSVISTTGIRVYPQPDGEMLVGAEWKVRALLQEGGL